VGRNSNQGNKDIGNNDDKRKSTHKCDEGNEDGRFNQEITDMVNLAQEIECEVKITRDNSDEIVNVVHTQEFGESRL
jgi:hypothetical protein